MRYKGSSVRILIAEDEARLSGQLAAALEDAGYAVDRAADGERADFLGQTEQYDAVVLDLGLPKLDGLSVLRRWRDAGVAVPVLVLTARGSWHEKVQGIDGGADDYLAKPLRPEEPLARLRALIRRARRPSTSEMPCGPAPWTRGPASHAGRSSRQADRLEFRVLSHLMHQRGRVVPQSELTEHIYAINSDRDSNTIEVFVARLRRKLGPDLIETVRGLATASRPGTRHMSSLRSRLMLGAVLWTFGLLAGTTMIFTVSARPQFDDGRARAQSHHLRRDPRSSPPAWSSSGALRPIEEIRPASRKCRAVSNSG